MFTHDDRNMFLKFYTFLKGLLIFLYYISFKNVALVHNHSAMKGSFWRKNIFSSIARLRGIPVLLHLHGSEMQTFYNNSSAYAKLKISTVLEKADRVIVLSKSWSEFIAQISPKAKTEILYNYVSLPSRESKSLDDGIPKVLFLGLLGKRKGVYDLIEVAQRLRENNKKFEFWIGGNGEVDSVSKLLEKNELTSFVKLLGWIDKQAREEYLGKSDIYILPSYNEGLPMSLLEAMSWQIPVISTNVGGIPELIRDGVDGLIVKPGNIDQIEEALMKLIDSKAERVRLGKNSKSRIESDFSDKVILPKLNKIYTKYGNWS